MNDPIQLRRRVRVVLSALPPDRRASEELLKAELDRFFPEPVTVMEMREAILWNQARDLVDYRRNADEERDEWFLTARGRAREGL